ncbi:MAG: ISAs1 family transposase [Methylococcales bacterium]|nr:ISAs1 family transposase [Methylococcales bacterium]
MPITTSNNNEPEITIEINERKFIDALKGLPDYRDNRGKWHSLTFFIVTVVFAMLVGRSKVFSIHRYMTHKIVWLREVTGIKDAPLVSRAHFPRMLENLDWQDLNRLINAFFDEKTVHIIANEWVAIDGKVMRGTIKSGEKQAIIHAVSHQSRFDVAQARQVGDKASEIPVTRELLKETRLSSKKISLDAHHCNPETMTQVNQDGGFFIIQVKKNQPKLLEKCRVLSKQTPLAEFTQHDAGHGRITSRHAVLQPLSVAEIDERWKASGLQTLVVMNRETFEKATQKKTTETSYYLSNCKNNNAKNTVKTLATAIRQHWSVESNNW